ncbi:MAG: hypothetical protein RIR11_3417 [Bacteroidota bacterium]
MDRVSILRGQLCVVFFALESGLHAAQSILECTLSSGQTAFALAMYDDWVIREF